MKKNDQFANIAVTGISVEGKGLKMPLPPQIDKTVLPISLTEPAKSIIPENMNTKEELYLELEKQKDYYKKYMRKLAPAIEGTRTKKAVDTFDWRIETQQDQYDIDHVFLGKGEWEKVKIPHYGKPLGNAVTYYRTEIELHRVKDDKAMFICFKAVDYKAHVFINKSYVGSHEGFFAPFEFDITDHIMDGKNTIVVKVENDFVHQKNSREQGGEFFGGDKIYAATGVGFDDAELGWHHCPPGMGIYNEVSIETRNRCFIDDVFVRPLPEDSKAQAWIQVYECDPTYEDVIVELSVYGRNFEETVFEKLIYVPDTELQIGLGDTHTETLLKRTGKINKPVHMYMEKGLNYLKIPFDIKDFRWWRQDTPYLYELQVVLKKANGDVLDTRTQSFGMRSFRMDTEEKPRGTFYLNGEKIRLRGANTMGHEQQCVLKKDFDQLLSDLLLAKICNMNFLRLTQRPVQEEIYEYCNMIGLLTQTDLPLFGVLRTNQFTEALRQTGEMERLVRKHPSNILVSYINEPFPNASNQPHRHLLRNELNDFFDCADMVVKLNNPDRVIKHVDGDYDPPSKLLPDNHCYTCWYNGNAVPLGALHKGYWLPVKEDWNYGCGEFGAEALDPVQLMRERYPKEWLPQTKEEEKDWQVNNIIGSQTGNFHYFFYETQHSMEDWVKASWKHQAWSLKWMTEAFRRNKRVITFACHLFIDAFPSGWMKTIMDVNRDPKTGYFAYRNALSPVMISLRTDRFTYFEDEKPSLEVWLCNDRPDSQQNIQLYYEIIKDDKVIYKGNSELSIDGSTSEYCGSIDFEAKEIGYYTIKSLLKDSQDNLLHVNEEKIKVHSKVEVDKSKSVYLVSENGKAKLLADEIGINISMKYTKDEQPVIIIDDYDDYIKDKQRIDKWIEDGARAVFLDQISGDYQFADKKITIKESSMTPLFFVSRDTGHPYVNGFEPEDFKNWYYREEDMIADILDSTFIDDSWNEILTSGNTDKDGNWQRVMAVGEYEYGQGKIILCQLKMNSRTKDNPVARKFALRLLS